MKTESKYQKIFYTDKLKLTNFRKPFADASYTQTETDSAQIKDIFNKYTFFKKYNYYQNGEIPELEVVDIADAYSNENFLIVFMFKQGCILYKFETTNEFGYTNPHVHNYSYEFYCSCGTDAKAIFLEYKLYINLEDAFGCYLGELNYPLFCNFSMISSVRNSEAWREEIKNKKDEELIVIERELKYMDDETIAAYEDAYELIAFKVLERIEHIRENRLTVFNMDNFYLEELPEEIGELTDLEILSLNDNKLKSLPWQISLLKKLHTINLCCNQFMEFPKQLLELPELRDLSLAGNPFKTVPPEIKNMEKLEKLNLPTIENIPERINKLNYRDKAKEIKEYFKNMEGK